MKKVNQRKISFMIIMLVVVFGFRFGFLDSLNAQKKTIQKKKISDFKKLPNDFVIKQGQKQMTKGEFLSKFKKRSRSIRSLSALRLKLKNNQKMKVQSDNGKMENLFQQQVLKSQNKAKKKFKLVNSSPKITSMFLVPPISPGEIALIQGTGFGNNKNSINVFLKSSKFSNGKKHFYVLDLLPNGVLKVKLPENISGVKDHDAKIQVVRNGIESNTKDTTFRATREVYPLLTQDFPTANITQPGNINPSDNSVTGFSCQHSYGVYGLGWDVIGTVSLKNNYEFVDYNLRPGPQHMNAEANGMAVITDFNHSASALVLTIFWMYGEQSSYIYGITYYLDIWVKGPKGFSYK